MSHLCPEAASPAQLWHNWEVHGADALDQATGAWQRLRSAASHPRAGMESGTGPRGLQLP
jgi:hypothetical protein